MAKPPKLKTVERKIYFYKFTCKCDGKPTPISDIFETYIKKANKDNSKLIERGLAVPYFDKYHYLDLRKHKSDKDIYSGWFYSLRNSDFPYLFNVLNGNRQEITSNEDDTLMEQTHFYCYIKCGLIVSEFNFHGARIEHLGRYLSRVMQNIHPSKFYDIEILPIVIPDYYKKIVNCKSISKIQFKVAKPGLQLLKEQGIINAYDIASGNFDPNEAFYVDIEISGAKRGSSVPVSDVRGFLSKVIKAIKKSEEVDIKDSNKDDPIFKKAKMRGYDAEEYKIIPYDLLDEKLLQVAKVEKLSPKTKYVNSDQMFLAIQDAFREKGVRRGMNINAEKCLSNGSNPGLGYTVDKERQFQIDPEGAAIVRQIFEMYASGKTVTEINKHLNDKQIKTSLGNAFNKNSLHRLLRNKRYIGTYVYKDQEVPYGMPHIIDNELFERVQHILDRNKKAPARSRGKQEYLLTTKLFCGHCREMMTGYGGTGKSGRAYYYYACKNAKKKLCRKKIVNKEIIEIRVVLECHKLLTEKNIRRLAKSVADATSANYDSSTVKRLKDSLKEVDTAIENLWKALESGQSVEMITGRIEKRKQEKEEIQTQLAIEMSKDVVYTEAQIYNFLHSLKEGNLNDENNRRGIINIFLHSIYLQDDRFTLMLNGGDKPIVIDDILLDEIEADNEVFECSRMVADAPPGNDSVIETTKTSRSSGGFRVLRLFLPALSGVFLACGCVTGGNLNPPEPLSAKVNPPRQI